MPAVILRGDGGEQNLVLTNLVADEEETSVQYNGQTVWEPGSEESPVAVDDESLYPDFDSKVETLLEKGKRSGDPMKIKVQELMKLVKESGGSMEWAEYVAELANLNRPAVMDKHLQGEMFYQQAVFSPLSLLFYCFNPGHYRADQGVWAGFECTLKQRMKTSPESDGTGQPGGDETTPGFGDSRDNDQPQPPAAAGRAGTGTPAMPSPAVDCGSEAPTCPDRQQGGDCAPAGASSHQSTVREYTCQPDAAIVASFDRSSLVLGTMELKPFSAKASSKLDMFKCVLVTSVTAIAMTRWDVADCINIPFVINQGETAHLYVTSMKKSSNAPVVKLVCTAAPIGNKEERVELIAKLSVVLSDVVLCMNTARGRRLRKFVSGKGPTKRSRSTSQKRSSTKRNKTNAPASDGTKTSEKSEEQRSHRGSGRGETTAGVAKCGGRVDNLSPLDPRGYEDSPYYYVGTLHRFDRMRERASCEVPVFIKVWREEDTSPEQVEAEIELLKLAHREGVPCPEVLPELCETSINYDGSMFHRLVMHRLVDYPVAARDLERYSASLIEAVLKLHRAGLYHCDIKPSNVVWNAATGTVSLVDFGHAQREVGATAYVGTEGYTAPEVQPDKEPHSQRSEAYSVGRTILEVAKNAGLSSSADSRAHRVAEGLSRQDPEARLTLEQALAALRAPTPAPCATNLTPGHGKIQMEASGQTPHPCGLMTLNPDGTKVSPDEKVAKAQNDSP
jgi:hypothetical protein